MEDTTLDSGLPSAVLVNGVVTINEVMASGTNTFRGVTGIDWVELKNNGDVDIDLVEQGFAIRTERPFQARSGCASCASGSACGGSCQA